MSIVSNGYLRLMRPANLPTAMADIFAGIGIVGIVLESSWITNTFLVLSSVFLYAGGVVLNDVFDYKLDQLERPERPIPSGIVSLKSAAFFGAILMFIGISFAFFVSTLSGNIAMILSGAIILYDAILKKIAFLGPLNMGICRGLNLLLGTTAAGMLIDIKYAIIPVVYIFAITLISRGEVHGNNKNNIVLAGLFYVSVVVLVLKFQFERIAVIPFQSIPFLLLFLFLILKPLRKAYINNTPKNIKKAVISGVLSIVVLDAALAAGFSYWWYGLLILLLLPLSMYLSKLFAVT